ncbi:MAG TPA: GNAT family N-acetyltransferase [Acidimicrobiales bacterium]|nr:GNAT family N-acetyltransferase [Acidimicrobiales bacterium]
MPPPEVCRACGSQDLRPAGRPTTRVVCARCGRCWEDAGRGPQVDALTCPGCPQRGRCEACLTWLAEEMTHRHVLADGQELLVRPLVAGDRDELAAGFAELSLRSRQLRFFQAPDELDAKHLDHLTNLDYRDHFACAGFLLGGPVPVGVGVARYLRDRDDPELAEVAVTVLDAHQRRGIGTILTRELAAVAASRGIRRFVSFLHWENDVAIDLLVQEGARITWEEPGVARVELDVPVAVEDVEESFPRRILRLIGELNDTFERWGR